MGALLLGKASQARERGIDWRVHIDPDTPRSPLSPVDSVAVLGNLIDNAMDAAADGNERWVEVSLTTSAAGGILLEVADSGTGIAAEIRDQVFTPRILDETGGGSGPRCRSRPRAAVVLGADGTVEVSGRPTTFRVVLPPAKGQRFA